MLASHAASSSKADVAVIGGTGLYEFLAAPESVPALTPYGEASGPVSVGEVAGRRVAFLPRHGAGHALPPHGINYRANLWLLRSLGVRQVIAPCAVGALAPDITPGTLVVPDQLVDRTTSRIGTFVEQGAVHVPFADPYCSRLTATLGRVDGVRLGGTMVVIEGPRFSTRAESRAYSAQGWSLINMTGAPEAALAREMQMCFASVAVVTDTDAGIEVGDGVSHAEVMAVFARTIGQLKAVLTGVIADLPSPDGCTCSTWADDLTLTYAVPGATA